MRCKCVIELASGDFVRCAQMVMDSTDEYCYYHGKQMGNPSNPKGCPAPREEYDPDRPVAYYRKESGGMSKVLTFEA